MRAKSKPNELRIIRTYDAPLKLVWEAWTDPAQQAHWWGPRGFTITTHSKDLRPGGTWHYTMHGPDGTDYPNLTVYHEVEEHARLVYDHGAYFDRPPLFRVTVLFSERKGKTEMDMTMALATEEQARETAKFIKQAGGNSTWDRLGEYLAKETAGREQFVINRSFKATPELLFKMWITPEHFAKWLPPVGMTMEFLRAEPVAGGTSFYRMTNGKDLTMYGRCRYLEIRSPDHIVYVQQFSDEDEGMGRHPMLPTWPETMLTTVEFTEEEPGVTGVRVTWEPHGNVTAEELAAFVTMRGGMTMGWTGSFDKLEALLAGTRP